MIKVSLEHLLTGFVNSFNSLLLPIDKDGYPNPSQETIAIINYFRYVGVSLGFESWTEAEEEKYDLDWYDVGNRIILHLESANRPEKMEETIDKLVKSKSKHAIGITWTKKRFNDFVKEKYLKKLSLATRENQREILLIVRHKLNKQSCEVRSYIARKGKHSHLKEYDWIMKRPRNETQTSVWKINK